LIPLFWSSRTLPISGGIDSYAHVNWAKGVPYDIAYLAVVDAFGLLTVLARDRPRVLPRRPSALVDVCCSEAGALFVVVDPSIAVADKVNVPMSAFNPVSALSLMSVSDGARKFGKDSAPLCNDTPALLNRSVRYKSQ
jgi:hypothetical protein